MFGICSNFVIFVTDDDEDDDDDDDDEDEADDDDDDDYLERFFDDILGGGGKILSRVNKWQHNIINTKINGDINGKILNPQKMMTTMMKRLLHRSRSWLPPMQSQPLPLQPL